MAANLTNKINFWGGTIKNQFLRRNNYNSKLDKTTDKNQGEM